MDDDDRHSGSRRRFLVTCAASTLSGLAGTGCVQAGADPAPVGVVDAGNISNIPVGTLRSIGGKPVAIGRDEMGLYAMTLTCTHAACNMATQGNVTASSVYCACHGSLFDRNGVVERGPAQDNLAHFLVEIDMQGNVTIQGDRQVSAAERTLVG